MDRYNERPYHSYSWHQSHDQATVLLMVPYSTQEEDLSVVIERNYLIVGVRGHNPIVKGRIYSTVDTTSSLWQLEPRAGAHLSSRERTISTASSTASTHSSYAFVSDPDISSSFAASIDSGQVSDADPDDGFSASPAFSSPVMASADERAFGGHGHVHTQRAHRRKTTSNSGGGMGGSRSVSPGHALRSIPSSTYSSLESLNLTSAHTGRLLTLHLEKEQSIIWPSLIVGPAPEQLSPALPGSVVFDASEEMEHQYNMDPTSLALIGLEMFDIRKEKEEAFECFVRSWHQARVPSATMRLVSHYLPLQSTPTSLFASSTVTSPSETQIETQPQPPLRGTTAYYQECIGGTRGLAQLYLEAGLLHLEGAASTLLSSSYSSLASIRMPLQAQVSEGGAEAWRRDREAAAKFFERASALAPGLDIPALPAEGEGYLGMQLEMPRLDVGSSAPESIRSGEESFPEHDLDSEHEIPVVRRRRRRDEKEEGKLLFDEGRKEGMDDMDSSWYLYLPGLVGAGTALLVVGIVGALSFSTWSRRNQGS